MKNSKLLIVLFLLVCSLVTLVACGHKHEISTDWEINADNHWHTCQGENCEEKFDEAAHSFGEGKVTTPATVEAEGVLTYTCTVCGFEKTEAIEKLDPPHEHSWETNWSYDETGHWHASSCGHDDTEKAEHIYDDGWVEKEATETEEGVIVYTCIDCGYFYNDVIPTTVHKHVYSEEWSYSETEHWHATTCGHNLKKNVEDHTYGEGKVTREPTEYEEGITSYECEICDYVKEEPIAKLPHEHKFATEWSSDDTHHWYASLCDHSDTEVKYTHDWNDGEITKDPTETEEGIRTFTCLDCGHTKEQSIPSLSHTHTYESEYSYDAEYHWYAPTCGHEDAVEKIAHDYDENGDCECGAHNVCQLCGGCLIASCELHETKCLFIDMNKVVTFAPQATYLGDPEGPDGKAPGSAGAYIYDRTITASQVVLNNGAHATLVTLPHGTKAHSGVSFWNNKNVSASGLAGYNCGIPQYANTPKVVRMHFTNTGNSEITFKYSAIDYYYDKGAVTLTLGAGESVSVLMSVTYASNTVGLNHQIVFTEDAAEGASLTIWGEFLAEGLDKSISVGAAADKRDFYVGDAFTAEGLVLRGSSSLIGNKVDSWTRVYISENYVTDLDGYVFTAEDVGTKTVTVTFAGLTTTYTINVVNHDDDLCDECGKCENQLCEYPDCGEKCQGHFDPTKLTVMSFNLGTNGVENQYNKPNLLNKLLAEMPDLLGTQEENSRWTAAITETLGRYGYMNVIMYRDGVENNDLGNEGAGIWYNSLRFTLEDWGYFWMSDTPDTSSIWSQYGAIYKRVTTWAKFTDKASGKSFVYYNTHIGYESEELWLRSADMIMTRMHAHYNEGYPVIITGDFNFALNTDGAMPAYERFMKGLNDPHYSATVKNYEVGKENTFSGYGQYQGAGDESISDVGNRSHVLPIDYMLYSDDFIAAEYSILREELPEGVSAPNRQYFSSDHFAIKTVFNFSEDWAKHVCWEPCDRCGLCLDDNCELCAEKCPGHHVCGETCPDCGLCINADGECEQEHCPRHKVTLVGATFEGGSDVFYGCQISASIVLTEGKTFEGFLDASKNYYTLEDLAGLELTGNVKFTALYQEDMIAWAQSDTCAYETAASAEHRLVNGRYVTTVTYPKGTAANTFFAGRGAKDSGSMPINWCAPADGKNVGIVYIYSYAEGDVKVQYMTENYGAQNEELIVTLKPGLNRIVLTFGIQASNNSFYSCDHRLILLEEAAEDIVLDTYGYFYDDGYVENFGVSTSSAKVTYKPGEAFTLDGLKVTAKIMGFSTVLHEYACDIAPGYVFTADDIGTKTVTVSMGDHVATFEIEIIDVDCEAGKHYNVKNVVDEYFVGIVGSDAIYNYVCAFCGAKSEETYALDKVSFVPHDNIGGGHSIEFVTLEDGRIAAKLTFNSDVAKGKTFTITANDVPSGTNVIFPVRGAGRRVYMEMISSADITLTWQPEFYGDRDGVTMELKASEAQGASWIVCYNTNSSYTSSDCPYQEIIAGSDIAAGTVVYFTGYFYTADEITGVSLNTSANKAEFKVGETFSSAGISFKPTATDSLYSKCVIYNVATDLDGYVFTADDIGKKLVTVTVCGIEYVYEITVSE